MFDLNVLESSLFFLQNHISKVVMAQLEKNNNKKTNKKKTKNNLHMFFSVYSNVPYLCFCLMLHVA